MTPRQAMATPWDVAADLIMAGRGESGPSNADERITIRLDDGTVRRVPPGVAKLRKALQI